MRALASACLGCLIAAPALAQGPVTGEQVYAVDTPPTLVLILNFAGADTRVDTTRALDAFDAALADASALRRARLPEDTGAACLEDPVSPDVCLVRAVIPAFDPLLPNVAQMRLSRLERALDEAPPAERPSVAVLLTVAPADVGARLRIRAFAVPEAVRRLVEAQQAAAAPLPATALEAIMERSLLVTARRDGVPADDRAVYADLFAQELAPLLAPFPKWGRLELTGLPEGAAITLSRGGEALVADRPAGARVTRFVDLRPGTYAVTAKAEGFAPARAEALEVGSGVLTHAFTLDPDTGAGRWATRIAGGALAGAGIGLGIYAATQAGGEGVTCPNRDCPDIGVAFSPTDDAGGADPNPGFPIAPVSAGLTAMGATWLVGAFVEGADDEIPWWSVAIGAAAGAIAFGAAYALTGAGSDVSDVPP